MSPSRTSEVQLWSGVETEAMKEAKCSLLVSPERKYEPRIKSLPKQALHVQHDKGLNASDGFIGTDGFEVDFKGCTIMQFEPVSDNDGKTMPVTLTAGGMCKFTKESYTHFKVMMRTEEESTQLKVVANGEFDWPNVDSMLMCPLCGKSAKVPTSSDDDALSYWMLFYPLVQVVVQKGSKLTLGLRTVCRLTCIDCMTEFLEGMLVVEKQSNTAEQKRRPSTLAYSLSAAEMLAEAGTVSFLQDSPPRPATRPNVDDEVDAWTLYSLWEHCGAWEALQIDYRMSLSRSMTAKTKSKDNLTSQPSSVPLDQIKAKERYGRKCGNVECKRVHGKRDSSGDVVRLTVLCERCRMVYYCSKSCRKAAAEHHKEGCDQRLREQMERKMKKTKKVQCDTCKLPRPHSEMKKCSGCKKATYCSVACQRKDWPRHKIRCRRIT